MNDMSLKAKIRKNNCSSERCGYFYLYALPASATIALKKTESELSQHDDRFPMIDYNSERSES